MSKPLITVFGATGAQGGGLARALLGSAERPFRVRAVTRRPGSAAAMALAALGAEILFADLDDAPSVRRALHRAHGAFCVADDGSLGAVGRARFDTMSHAARDEGVAHLIWSTPVDGANETNRELARRALPATLLATPFEWDRMMHHGSTLQCDADGRLVLAVAMTDAPLPGIAAGDVGACAAALFRQGASAIGRCVGIAGDHLTVAQMAQALSRALGEAVIPAALVGAGEERPDRRRSHRFAREFNALCRAALPVDSTRALHPGLLSFDAWLARHAARLPVPSRWLA